MSSTPPDLLDRDPSPTGAALAGAAPEPRHAATGSQSDATTRRGLIILLVGLVISLAMAAALSGSYLSAMHHPTPRAMKVEVIGTSSQSQQLASSLSVRSNHQFDVTTTATTAQAERDVRDLEVRAAYNPATGELYTATAGSPLATQTATGLFTPAAQQARKALVVHDLVPRAPHDTSGLSVLFMALGATLCGYMSASAVSMVAPRLSSVKLLAVIAAMSVAGAITITFVTYGFYGAYTSHLAPVLGLLALTQFTAAVFQYAGYQLIGAPMSLISIIVMVVLGSPAAGVVVPADMLPRFFGWLHPLLPTSAAAEALRRVLNFGGTGTARSVTVLLAWLMGSFWMLHIATLRRARTPHPTTPAPLESR